MFNRVLVPINIYIKNVTTDTHTTNSYNLVSLISFYKSENET